MRLSPRSSFRFLILLALAIALPGARAEAQCISLTTPGGSYSQNFDSLALSGTSSALPSGWFLGETGTNANATYTAGTGSSNSGDSYSYGVAASTDRALGGLRSGSLIPVFGSCYTNNTGAAISDLQVAYTGEQWRLGTASRTDQINFEYSLNATDLATGAWTGVSGLNFVTPDTTTTGAKVGNNSGQRTALSSTIAALSIPNGATFWIRWTDTDASGADDGLSVDDFSITPGNGPVTPSLTINDITRAEGDSGSTTFTFTVSLSAPAGVGGVTFDIATVDGTALAANSDYSAASLSGQTIPEGDSTRTFNVSVLGDTTIESDEAFFVNVTNVVGATAGDSQGIGTILNDDFAVVTAIHDIQGAGATSPLVGNTVTTQGIVTGVKSNGFFVQSTNEDGDPNTSEGIFVFTSSAPSPASVAVGNQVYVTATVAEFVPSSDTQQPPVTELTSPTIILQSTGNALPAPQALSPTLPDPMGAFDQLERLEGMRVSVASMTVVSATDGSVTESAATAGSNGVFAGVVTGVPRPFRTVGIQAPDMPETGSIPPIPRFDTNPEVLSVDSDAGGGAQVNVSAGATVTNVVGPLDYGFRRYTIIPTGVIGVTDTVAPKAVADALPSEVTIASFNMERFFDTVNDPESDVVLTTTAFNNRLNKASLGIRNFLKMPDIVGVQEVEHLTTLQAVATKINNDAIAATQPNPNYVAYLIEGNDVGGIDVGYLVKTAIVTGATPRVSVSSVTQVGASTLLKDVNGDPVAGDFLNDRPSLVLKAVVNSANGNSYPVTVINNHLKSLISVDSLGSPGSNGYSTVGARNRAKRLQQSVELANYIQTLQTNDPNENIVLVGDFNAFGFNDGYVDMIGTIKGTPSADDQTVVPNDGADLVGPDLIDLDTSDPAERYSYVFDGNAQTLDHVLLSQAVLNSTSLRRLEHARINADFKSIDRSDPLTPRRLSDHDPAVAYLTIPTLAAVPVVDSLSISASGLDATFGANVVSDGGSSIIERGFAYSSTSSDPAPGDSGVTVVPVAGDLGGMSTSVSGLKALTTYYFRAYAKNANGVGITGAGSFSTGCPTISIVPSGPITGIVGQPFSVTFNATTNGGPITYYYIDDYLPDGLTVDGNTISGTPTESGEFQVYVEAGDDSTCYGDQNFYLSFGAAAALGDVVISEFRTVGVKGGQDEYIELANRSDKDIVVLSTDGSGGWSLGKPGTRYAFIEDGYIIPKGGHWLTVGGYFSLDEYRGAVGDEDFDAGVDIPTDGGFGLFTTADANAYSAENLLDAVGTGSEEDPLLVEGDGLAPIGDSPQSAQTAWVRRQADTGSLVDNGDNRKDFVFVATDGGTYGPPLIPSLRGRPRVGGGGPVAAVFGAPNPEDSLSVRDILNSELPAGLLTDERGPQQQPNRLVDPSYSVEYRRTFTNNSGMDIRDLSFKVTNLSTYNSQALFGTQADLRVMSDDDDYLEGIYFSGPVAGAQLHNPYIYYSGEYSEYLHPYDSDYGVYAGGVNSRLNIDLYSYFGGGGQLRGGNVAKGAKRLGPCDALFYDGDSINVSLKARIYSGGYYLFVVMPQVSFDEGLRGRKLSILKDPSLCCGDCVVPR